MMKKIILSLLIAGLSMATFAQAININNSVTKGDTAQILLDLKVGGNINAVDKYGGTPLQTAARWNLDTVVDFLIRHGAGVDTPRSAAGRTALMVTCAYYGGIKICSLLLAYGANVNAQTTNGTTALMLAASNAKADVVELLLRHGADKNLKDSKGKTALDYARQTTVEDWLIKSNKDAVIDKERTIKALAQ